MFRIARLGIAGTPAEVACIETVFFACAAPYPLGEKRAGHLLLDQSTLEGIPLRCDVALDS